MMRISGKGTDVPLISIVDIIGQERVLARHPARGRDALFPFRSELAPAARLMRRGAFYAAAIVLGIFYGFWGTVLPAAFIVLMVVPILILFGLLLWVMPDTRAAASRPSWLLFMAFTAVTFLWPNYLGLSLPSAPVLSLRRVVGLALMLVFLVHMASSHEARAQVKEQLSGFPLLWKLLVGFAIVQVIAIGHADNWYLAYRFWFNALYAWIALFFVAVFVFATPGRIEAWAKLIACCAILVACIAIAVVVDQERCDARLLARRHAQRRVGRRAGR